MATPSSSGDPSSSAPSSQFTYSNGSSYFPLPFHLQQPPAVSQYPAPYAAAQPTAQPLLIPAPPVVAPVYPAPAAPVAGVYTLPQYQQVIIKTPRYCKFILYIYMHIYKIFCLIFFVFNVCFRFDHSFKNGANFI